MKPQRLPKKLTLSKKTAAHLNGNEMIKVKGGQLHNVYFGLFYPPYDMPR